MKTNKSNRTSFLILISVLIVLVFTFGNVSGQKSEVTPGWPKITKESKPWSRWWWMGNSVSPSDLKVAMEAYSKAGLGGLEITPIYGVHGYENRFIKFLSPEWIENFKYTCLLYTSPSPRD